MVAVDPLQPQPALRLAGAFAGDDMKTRFAQLVHKGWMTQLECMVLQRIAKRATPTRPIVNIGVEYGASLACFREGHTTAHIYGIDLDCTKATLDIKGDPNITLITSDSGAFAHEWRDTPLSVAFIDGDHSFDGVMRDTAWCNHVAVGGAAVFHDCYEWPPDTTGGKYDPHFLWGGKVRSVCPEVTAAVDAWRASEPQGRWRELPYAHSMRIFLRVE